MRGLIAGSILLVILAVFFLLVPAIQMRHDGAARTQRDQAIIVSNIAAALARSSIYRIMVAEFFAQHGYFPSHIDEVDPRFRVENSAKEDANKANDIEIANFGDVVLVIRDANDIAAGKVTLTASDDERTGAISWECHTTDFEKIRSHFPQCRYKVEAR